MQIDAGRVGGERRVGVTQGARQTPHTAPRLPAHRTVHRF